MEGKVCLVTGANSGIGRETAIGLARRGARVVLASRSEEKSRPVLDEIAADEGAGDAEFLPLDLGSLASVRSAADDVLARGLPLHLLINNAGLAGSRGLTEDGFERTFGVNHLGPFLLTNLLLGALRDAAPARIVNVASHAHYGARGIDFEAQKRPTASLTGFPEYRVSKLANVLFTAELARRLEGSGVTTYAVHPGVIASDIWRRVPWPIRPLATAFMKSPEEGARPSLYLATSPEVADHSGRYYEGERERKPSRSARDPELARALWEESEAFCGL